MVRSFPVDQEVAWDRLLLWAADLTGPTQARVIVHAATVSRLACLHEGLAGFGLGMASEPEPPALN